MEHTYMCTCTYLFPICVDAPIAELYEHAVEKYPSNEEYLTHLFMAYVRIGNYKKQQQVAVKLHKLKPDNNPYYYWSVMSLILQVTDFRYTTGNYSHLHYR